MNAGGHDGAEGETRATLTYPGGSAEFPILPSVDGAGDLQQGNLEQSNVDSVSEITNLISAQRAYEMNSKVITAADQMLSTTSNLMH